MFELIFANFSMSWLLHCLIWKQRDRIEGTHQHQKVQSTKYPNLLANGKDFGLKSSEIQDLSETIKINQLLFCSLWCRHRPKRRRKEKLLLVVSWAKRFLSSLLSSDTLNVILRENAGHLKSCRKLRQWHRAHLTSFQMIRSFSNVLVMKVSKPNLQTYCFVVKRCLKGGGGYPKNKHMRWLGLLSPFFFSLHLTACTLKVTHLGQISPDKWVVEYQDSGWNLYNVWRNPSQLMIDGGSLIIQ